MIRVITSAPSMRRQQVLDELLEAISTLAVTHREIARLLLTNVQNKLDNQPER